MSLRGAHAADADIVGNERVARREDINQAVRDVPRRRHDKAEDNESGSIEGDDAQHSAVEKRLDSGLYARAFGFHAESVEPRHGLRERLFVDFP